MENILYITLYLNDINDIMNYNLKSNKNICIFKMMMTLIFIKNQI